MALVLGTNSGFVTVAPTTDPAGSFGAQISNTSVVTKDTSPSSAIVITEVGWWCDNATEESNFELALYSADGAVVPGEAGTRLYVSSTNAKGTTSGWKKISGLTWTISGSTSYWLGLQVDTTATATNTDMSNSSGLGRDGRSSATTLPNPYGGGALVNATGIIAIYAVYSDTMPANTGNFFQFI